MYIIQTRIADNSDSDPGNQFYPQLVGECMESNIRRKSWWLMNYEFFLSKEDHRSYSLLKYLEASSNLSESISNV